MKKTGAVLFRRRGFFRSAERADELVGDGLIECGRIRDLVRIAFAHKHLARDWHVGGVAGMAGVLDVLVCDAVDDLLAVVAHGVVGGLVLIDGCHVLRMGDGGVADGLVGDRPVVLAGLVGGYGRLDFRLFCDGSVLRA